MKPLRLQRAATAIFFAGYLAMGLLVFRDYGISRDETISRQNGRVAAKYVVETLAPSIAPADEGWRNIPKLDDWVDKDYGVIFDLPVYGLERLFHITDSRQAYFVRHLATFLLFYLGVVLFYRLAAGSFGSGWMGLAGAVLLVVTPRIFAESFYNSKDVLFLSAYVLGLFSLTRFLRRKTPANAALLGLAAAVAVNLRVAGIIVPAMAALFIAVDLIVQRPKSEEVRRLVLSLAVWVAASAILTVVLYPYLWSDPAARFVEVLRKMGKFRWVGTVLYFGEFIKATDLPWHYVPVWMLITIPPVYTLFFLVGAAAVLVRLASPGLRDEGVRRELLFLASLVLPLGAVILFRSVVYDGWRQMYFVYAPFLLVALSGLRAVAGMLRSARRAERVFSAAMMALLAAGVAFTAAGMIRNHPHQNVYFNGLIGRRTVEQAFDRDYWGLSYRQGLEYVARTDGRDPLRFASNYHTDALLMLPQADRQRLRRVELAEADYLLSEYRWHLDEYPPELEVYSIRSYGVKILTVLKLK